MLNIKRIMLAPSSSVTEVELETKIRYPVLCSPKLDGIRNIMHPILGPVTRKLKPLPNVYVRQQLAGQSALIGLDGELTTINEQGIVDPFNTIQSKLMSHGGEPRMTYYVFDVLRDLPYLTRYQMVRELVQSYCISASDSAPVVSYVSHLEARNADEVRILVDDFIRQGYEGLMIRSMAGPYKQGRSTLNQGWLLKYKPFADASGQIVGFKPLEHNRNIAKKDALGYTKRSSEKAGMETSTTMLGALILQTDWGELSLGSGFDFATREEIWKNQEKYLHRWVDFKYQVNGMLNKPRFPTFLRFREDLDYDNN